jgi:hypothetical protein
LANERQQQLTTFAVWRLCRLLTGVVDAAPAAPTVARRRQQELYGSKKMRLVAPLLAWPMWYYFTLGQI